MMEAYRTGRSKIKVRAKTEVEREKSGKSRIVVTELPYQVNKASLLKKKCCMKICRNESASSMR